MSTLTIARALRAAEIVEVKLTSAVVPEPSESYEAAFTEQEDGSSRCNQCHGDYYACEC